MKNVSCHQVFHIDMIVSRDGFLQVFRAKIDTCLTRLLVVTKTQTMLVGPTRVRRLSQVLLGNKLLEKIYIKLVVLDPGSSIYRLQA